MNNPIVWTLSYAVTTLRNDNAGIVFTQQVSWGITNNAKADLTGKASVVLQHMDHTCSSDINNALPVSIYKSVAADAPHGLFFPSGLRSNYVYNAVISLGHSLTIPCIHSLLPLWFLLRCSQSYIHISSGSINQPTSKQWSPHPHTHVIWWWGVMHHLICITCGLLL